jgi:hypothetical protein
LKIAVYTIALNESAHVERWANSAADADYRIVADTGSTDDTPSPGNRQKPQNATK